MNLRGLTQAQVLESRQKYGKNQMPQPKLKTAWQFFVEVFQDKLNLILLLMMVIFIGLGVSGYGSISEAIGIGIVLVVVALTTVSTKLKSQKSAEELYQRASVQDVSVIRDGKTRQIDSKDVVVGDIISLQAGEKICADGYLVYGQIDVNNAILKAKFIFETTRTFKQKLIDEELIDVLCYNKPFSEYVPEYDTNFKFDAPSFIADVKTLPKRTIISKYSFSNFVFSLFHTCHLLIYHLAFL